MGVVLLVWTVIAIAAVVVITVVVTRHFLAGGSRSDEAVAASLAQLRADVERLAAGQDASGRVARAPRSRSG
jgi:outer membrane murein-binding lipoprotein Lpp